MERVRPYASATYRVVHQSDGAFGVEVTIPETHPTTVTSFATAEDAEAWIARHKSALPMSELQVAAGGRSEALRTEGTGFSEPALARADTSPPATALG